MIEDKNIIIKNLSENIAYYRKQFNLTQLELAEKLNYSDKSISKWERAEGVPDIYVIAELSQFFGVPIDHLVKERKIPTPLFKRQQAIACFYALIAWVVAGIAFGILQMFDINYTSWHLFIYAMPVSSMIMMIMNLTWKKMGWVFLYITIFVWTLALSFNITFHMIEGYIFYIIATPIYLFLLYVLFLVVFQKKIRIRKDKRINK